MIEPAMQEIQWRRVAPAYVWIEVIGGLIWLVILGAATAALVLAGLPWYAWLWPAVLAALALASTCLAYARARSIGYALREDDLVLRRGVWWQRQVAVPYGRMQLVDIDRGPIARALGLAQLKLVTAAAATNAILPGLRADEAERLRDHLVRVAESRRAGL